MKTNPILIISVLVLLCGCTVSPAPNDPLSSQVSIDKKGESYRIVKIDGCQYIIFYGFYSNSNTVIVHKGNCNNPIHLK